MSGDNLAVWANSIGRFNRKVGGPICIILSIALLFVRPHFAEIADRLSLCVLIQFMVCR